MGQVIWSPQAIEDVDSACQFIARDSVRYAQVFVDRIFAAVERLERFPQSGRAVPEYVRSDYREIQFQSYRVIYRVVGEDVEIVTVHHGARQLGAIEP